MKAWAPSLVPVVLLVASCLHAQSTDHPAAALRIDSRAVLVDVIVMDKSGKPVKDLPQDAFTITEDKRPQTIQFFEEHKADERQGSPKELPKLPENTFSNFSPFPQPPVVNVLLLDSLNTTMADQSYVHSQAVQFLKSARPGDRMAIFTMDLGLHFIQGFNDDPTVLAAALEYKKNNWVGNSVMLNSQEETNAQANLVGMMSEQVGGGGGGVATTSSSPGMLESLVRFLNENDAARADDRIWITLQNLQRLSAFLESFPGRKNVIWFAENVPGVFVGGGTLGASGLASGDSGLTREIKKTLTMLSTARVALYPVQPSGVSNYSVYNAETNLSHAANGPAQMMQAFDNSRMRDAAVRNANQLNAERVAEESGGRAFANTNALAKVMEGAVGDSGNFYTLSYAPSNGNMDGAYRSIHVGVRGDYRLSYRRGYYAVEDSLPGGALATRGVMLQKMAEKSAAEVDPLLPFMSLGMPQTQQVLYKAKIQQMPSSGSESAAENKTTQYGIDFAIDLDDLKFNTDSDGLRTDVLNLSIIAFDRYGNIVARRDHLVQLNVKPNVWEAYKQSGVQLHGEIAVPQKGNFWLRTGVYDRSSHKVGTMEVPLSAIRPTQTAQAMQHH